MKIFLTYLWENPRLFFSVMIIVVLSICIHEFMHAFAALKLGDDTAAKRGHLTLNPFKQMGWFSLILFCFLGLAWGRVPVNPANLRGKYAHAIVALAGPLSNIVLSQIFVILTFICYKNHIGDDFSVSMLYYGAAINMVLFILNMLPIPPLDGHTVLHTFVPSLSSTSSETVKGAFFIMVALLFVFFNQLYKAAYAVTGSELLVLEWLTK